MGPAEVREQCAVDANGQALLRAAMEAREYTGRTYVRQRMSVRRILRPAIADLAGSDGIQAPHLAEAIQYRPRRMG